MTRRTISEPLCTSGAAATAHNQHYGQLSESDFAALSDRTVMGGWFGKGSRRAGPSSPRVVDSVDGVSISYLTADRPTATTCSALNSYKAIGEDPLQGGEQQVRVEFDYDGGGVGKGGKATLYVDGDERASTRVDATVPAMFSADETTDLGIDTATGVTDDLDHKTVKFTGKFTGKFNRVQIDLAEAAADEDHRISPEERYRIAMARQ